MQGPPSSDECDGSDGDLPPAPADGGGRMWADDSELDQPDTMRERPASVGKNRESGRNTSAYLQRHPDFLESYVSRHVKTDTLRRWLAERSAPQAAQAGGKNGGRGAHISPYWQLSNHKEKRAELQALHEHGAMDILEQAAASIARALDADGHRVYDANGKQYRKQSVGGKVRNKSLVATALLSGKLASTDNINTDNKYPTGLGTSASAEAAVALPVFTCDNQTAGVLLVYRAKGRPAFSGAQEETASTISLWAGAAMRYSGEVAELHMHRRQSDFLLSVARAMFQDMVSMDTLIMKIMNFAQKLVDADRASLFLVDHRRAELHARIFDVGLGAPDSVLLEAGGGDAAKEIRFPLGTGIAGHVATTGSGLNIADAYADSRFNRDVDSRTGYVTKSILCMPIFTRGYTIGVVEMVNKRSGPFTAGDERAFEPFAVFCGLALHHAKLYERINRSEQRYRVALEVLGYHSVCTQDEVDKVKRQTVPDKVEMIDSFEYNALKLDELQKPLYAVHMFKRLFGFNQFDADDLTRFVLTVRKNYRKVPYHNWTHGWTVAHAMFVILLKDEQKVWRPLERLAMYVACLCHDLDHRGKTNAYMKSASTPLAAIYGTSVMEHHHFNQTVTILQHDGHNIFKALTGDEYKWMLRNIKHCILATDLALFFANKARLARLVADAAFVWESAEHRLLAQAIAMTGCDLIASAKPWSVQTETVKVIFEEFYQQGDVERESGNEPLAMMDRHKAHELPAMQVGFMGGICCPCYELLGRILPPAGVLVEKAKYNLQKWQEMADKQKASSS